MIKDDSEFLNNKELLNFFLNDYYFRYWKGNYNTKIIKSVELIISPSCNLGCEYCYIHANRGKLFPKGSYNMDTVYNNAEMFIDWIIKERFIVNQIELFSGELFAQEIGFKILNMIYDKIIKSEYIPINRITIPTNFTFILDEKTTKRVEEIIYKFKDIGVMFSLSASIDGKFLESENRPIIKELDIEYENKERDDSYYDKVFSFIEKHKLGLHPMIYSGGIEKWKDNLEWFSEQLESHGMEWWRLYLLQVRNKEWTLEQTIELRKFATWAVEWMFKKCGEDKDEFARMMANKKDLNICGSIYGTNSRGISCSIQSTLMIRLSDLNIIPCHRTMYEGFEFGKFIVEEGRLTGEVDPKNIELFLTTISHDQRSAPYCYTCPIKNICTGGCLGSQLEVTGDMFTPIPSMCVMQHALAAGLIEGYLKIGVYSSLISKLNKDQSKEWEYIREEILKYEK